MLDRLSEHLKSTNLLPKGAKVVVGYSGGADSTCLLHLLRQLGYETVAAHLHHGMRVEADDEMARAADFCEKLGIAFAGGRADVPRLAADEKVGIEEAGRMARYAFFDEVLKSTGFDVVATAHSRTDLVETVLLNLVRGCGLSGMAGIPERNGSVVRPLLSFSRSELRAYCTEHGLWFHDDPANADVDFSRARLRHEVLPQLELLNPRFEEAIGRFASIAESENRVLNGAAAAALEQCERPLNGVLEFLTSDAEVAFDRSSLRHLPPALLRRAMRLAVAAVGGELDFESTGRICRGVCLDETGSVMALGGTVVIDWSSELVHVRRICPADQRVFPVGLPCDIADQECGWRFQAVATKGPVSKPERASLSTETDADRIQGPLVLRCFQKGDAIQPLGFEGTRKASDLLSEFHLTQAAKGRLPILCDRLGPIWIPGICLSNRVKSTENTLNAIRLTFGPCGR